MCENVVWEVAFLCGCREGIKTRLLICEIKKKRNGIKKETP